MQSEVMDLGDKVFKSSPFARKTMKISAYTSDEAAESVSGAAHGDSVAIAADLFQFKGVMAAHRPALPGAVDHLPAIGRRRSQS